MPYDLQKAIHGSDSAVHQYAVHQDFNRRPPVRQIDDFVDAAGRIKKQRNQAGTDFILPV